VIAAFVYLISFLEVIGLSSKIGMDLSSYFEPIDCVKVAPIWAALLILIVTYFWLFILYGKLFASMMKPLFKSLRRPVFLDDLTEYLERHLFSGQRPFTKEVVLLICIANLIVLIPILISFNLGRYSYIGVRHSGVSSVFRKGISLPDKGRVITQTSRYVLLLVGSHSVEAIPQTEVVKIVTPPNPKRTSPTATPGKK
jgi:hypothetical protein